MVCRSLALGCAAALCLWLGMAAPAAAAQTPALLAAAQQAAVQAPELSLPCRAAVLIDQGTGTVLYEKNASQRVPIASITKVMTLLLTFEAIHDGRLTLDTPVPVSEHAASMGGSQIWIEPGEHFTLDEMLRAICVSSANDAAVAVAELVGGSEEAFVAQMNAKAAQLGMEDTTFKNACGLDTEGHLSTARDVAVMSRAILNECPEVLHYSGIWTDTLRGGETMLVNTNKLLRRYEGITGLKTGTTGGAGVCISASASRDGLDLIAVVLGSSSSAERFEAATTLLDYGFSAYEAAPLPDLGGRPLYLDVTGSIVEDVPLDYTALPESLLVPKGGAGALTARVDLPAVSGAPLERGSQVGSVTILSGEQPVGSWPVRAAADAAVLDLAGAVRLMAETFL
ncbi:MAG TPA: D-alanyl-D-alanine carboxypeptidase [Candidatus Faecalibacterium avium]|nr:D-alanyl-D-alanine carboxypeptidase [Candidatus Faecalibacterium avium]